ncbi:MAG: hypothetical protein QOH66_875 [Actinomycetota bacterium]|jgi:hypothetical protein|nr:hypothetical protein [Actinomycetota bacterium]
MAIHVVPHAGSSAVVVDLEPRSLQSTHLKDPTQPGEMTPGNGCGVGTGDLLKERLTQRTGHSKVTGGSPEFTRQ